MGTLSPKKALSLGSAVKKTTVRFPGAGSVYSLKPRALVLSGQKDGLTITGPTHKPGKTQCGILITVLSFTAILNVQDNLFN